MERGVSSGNRQWWNEQNAEKQATIQAPGTVSDTELVRSQIPKAGGGREGAGLASGDPSHPLSQGGREWYSGRDGGCSGGGDGGSRRSDC